MNSYTGKIKNSGTQTVEAPQKLIKKKKTVVKSETKSGGKKK